MQIFSAYHALSYSNVGLIIARHNDIFDDIFHLARQAFPTNCVRGKPLIYEGNIRSDEEVCQGARRLETSGDILIQGLWKIYTDAIIGVRFGDLDADTYRKEPMDKLLARLGEGK